MTKLAAILDQIDSGSVLLPEFQRGHGRNRDQVRGLMRSLYRGYPVGGLLTWETQADGSLVRRAALASPALRVLTLDGQQRTASLYGHHRECRRDPDEPVRCAAPVPGADGPGSGTGRHRLSGGCQVAGHD